MIGAIGQQASRKYVEAKLKVPTTLDVQTGSYASMPDSHSSVLTNVRIDEYGNLRCRYGMADPYGTFGTTDYGSGGAAEVCRFGTSDKIIWMNYNSSTFKYSFHVTSTILKTSLGAVKDGVGGADIALDTKPIFHRSPDGIYALVPVAGGTGPGGVATHYLYRFRYVSSTYILELAGVYTGSIAAVLASGSSGVGPGGTYGFAIEFAIQESGADVTASSPQRYKYAGVVTTADSPAGAVCELQFTNPLTASDDWDVIRFYRTVDIANEESPGTVDEMYMIEEFTRAAWTARSGSNQIRYICTFEKTDEQLLESGTLVSYPDMDLARMGSANITSIRWCNGRFWFGTWSGSKIFLYAGSTGKYKEAYGLAEIYEAGSNPNGISALEVLGDDLLICRPSETGCFYNPSTDAAEYVIIDAGVGVAKPDGIKAVKRRVAVGMTNVGLRCNSLYEWDTKYQDSVEVSLAFPATTHSAAIAATVCGNLVFLYAAGKLVVLDEEAKTLSSWTIGTNASVPIPLFTYGAVQHLSMAGVWITYQEYNAVDQDYALSDYPVNISWSASLAALRDPDGGDGLLEQKQVDVLVEDVTSAISLSAAGVAAQPIALTSTPAASSSTTNGYGRLRFSTGDTPYGRVIGERILYTLSGTGAFNISGIVWKGFVMAGLSRDVRVLDESTTDVALTGFLSGLCGRIARSEFTRDAVTGYALEEG